MNEKVSMLKEKAKELRKKIEEKQKNELFSVLIVSEKCCYR